MGYELTDFEWTAIMPFPPSTPPRRAEGQRPGSPQRHFLDAALGRTLAYAFFLTVGVL